MSTVLENDADVDLAHRTAFDGRWIGERNVPIEVTSTGQMVKLHYPAENGGAAATFPGFVGRIGQPVLYALFRGDTAHTGVLTEDRQHVRWSNGTDWRRVK